MGCARTTHFYVCQNLFQKIQSWLEESFDYSFTFLYYFRKPFTSQSCLRVLPQGSRPARHPLTEVKPYPAGLQLGWVTLKKYPVLYAIFFFSLPSPFFFSVFINDTSDPSSFILTVCLFFLRNHPKMIKYPHRFHGLLAATPRPGVEDLPIFFFIALLRLWVHARVDDTTWKLFLFKFSSSQSTPKYRYHDAT